MVTSCAILRRGLRAPIFLIVFLSPAISQEFVSNGKPSEQVVICYEKEVTAGALLTPDGWKRTAALFEYSQPYRSNGVIHVMSTGGAVGETASSGNIAQVETKWTDYFGSISSDLVYRPPSDPPVTMTAYMFALHFTNAHTDLSRSGATLKTTYGTARWKLKGPLKERWATPNKAIQYVMKMRDASNDAVIRRNAERTIRALRALQNCGANSAC